jgi:anti-sigma regulatory factor (Ser/Thr protein kinase)
MRPPHLHPVRVPEPLARGLSGSDMGPFQGYSSRAPFPTSGGGSAPRFGPRVELELDYGPDAAAQARAAVAALEERVNPDVLDDVRLLMSEIVTNAVRHSDSPPGAKIGMTVSVGREALRGQVTDGGLGFAPKPRSAPATEAGGWGLHLVDRLASRWGVDGGASVRVWFEIDLAS